MTTFIRADRLIDGTGAAPVENAVLKIEDGRIAAVIPAGESAGLGDADILDFPGCTILPGLIDTHVHLNLPGDGTILEDAMRETEGVLLATSAHSALTALRAGITTVRDLGAAGRTSIDLRRALQLGYGEGARVVACGQPITITGGHTWYFGGEADGVDNLRRKVRELCKLGADFIKVMASGGGTIGTISYKPSFSQDELDVIVEEAHALGRKATAHCLCAESIDAAIHAGFDQIEHAGFIADARGNQAFDPAVAERLARSGIPVTSTLAVGGAVLKTLQAKDELTAAEQAMLTRWIKMHGDNLAQFRTLREMGVRFVAGTDAGWRFTAFDHLPLEMALMREGGMTALEAIHAATGFAAEVIDIADEVGTLKAGLAADVIVVEGDPSADLGALERLKLVLQGGQPRHFGKASLTA